MRKLHLNCEADAETTPPLELRSLVTMDQVSSFLEKRSRNTLNMPALASTSPKQKPKKLEIKLSIMAGLELVHLARTGENHFTALAYLSLLHSELLDQIYRYSSFSADTGCFTNAQSCNRQFLHNRC